MGTGKVDRKHSIFGDYLTGDTKSMPDNELTEKITEIRDYNALWSKYVSTRTWGGFATEKGFEKWLQEQVREATDAHR